MFQEVRAKGRAGMTCVAALAACVATAVPAAAQECAIVGEGDFNVCGFVWDDANNNGVQDAGETGIEGVRVTILDGSEVLGDAYTDVNGFYQVGAPEGTYSLAVLISSIAPGAQPSPSDSPLTTDELDSDGRLDATGLYSVVTITVVEGGGIQNFDFGFHTPPPVSQPGTGTPGYWKNHPHAWPVSSITVGGVTYTKAEAIAHLGKVSKDKTTTMFSSLVPAMLNVAIGNNSDCVAMTIARAQDWMALYGPAGRGVPASSPAWNAEGEPLHAIMDAYNNGKLCAQARN